MKKLQVGYSDMCPKYHMPSTHAEVSAINKIIRWKNIPCINLLVVRINNNGEFVNSMPCIDCIKFILRKAKQIRIKNIYYSNKDGKIECIKVSSIIGRKDLEVIFNKSFGTRMKALEKIYVNM